MLQATRNIDGLIYTITYDAAADKITIADRVNRMEYDAIVDNKDNRISAVLDSARPLAGPPSFEQLQAVLKGNAPGAEFINGRLAMSAFLVAVAQETITGESFVTHANLIPALGLALAVTAASIAPAFSSTQPVEKLFPDSNASYADDTLPYFFTPLAEAINGRVCMVALAVIAIEELVKGGPVL